MITRYFLLLFILFSAHSYAADTISYPRHRLASVDTSYLKQYIASQYPDLMAEQLQWQSSKATAHAQHHSFAIHWQQARIDQASIKLSITPERSVICLQAFYPSLSSLPAVASALRPWQEADTVTFCKQYQLVPHHIKRIDHRWYEHKGEWHHVYAVEASDYRFDKVYYLDASMQCVDQRSRELYFQTDTTVAVRIFSPDPLTTVGQTYGGVYVDGADADLPWFAPAYQQATIRARYNSVDQKFYLESNLILIDDFEAPAVAPAESTSPSFMYNRSEGGFEDCMVMYHIQQYHDYIASLGYDTLMKLPLRADTHGQFGADNSVFVRNAGNPTISFGVGGVDDAEDADVIIHEYAHGLSWSANDNDNFTPERSGLDEGLADYLATSYSRSINPFGWQRMFSWDGHNQYWGGRTAATSNTYPVSGNIYTVGEVWNAAMSEIWSDVGVIVADKLMLESMFFYTNQTSLPQAARHILMADTLLFGAQFSPVLCARFQQRGLLTADCKPTSIVSTERELLSVMNSAGFAAGTSSLRVEAPGMIRNAYVYTMQGQCVYTTIPNATLLELEPLLFPSGMYVLAVHTANGVQMFKLLRM